MLFTFLRRSDISVAALGLGSWQRGRRQLLWGTLLGFLVVGVIVLVDGLLGFCRVEIYPDIFRVVRTVTIFFPVAFLVGILEELIFRGYVLQQLLACSRSMAIVLSSLAYALVHLRQQFVWPAAALELVGLTILGVVLCLSCLKTGQLYWAIGFHAAVAYMARVNKLFLVFEHPTWTWFIGTGRLVNGVMAWCVLGIIGGLLIRWHGTAQAEDRG